MKKTVKTGLFVAIALLCFYGYYQYNQHRMTEEIAGKIIRFHVRANSDTTIDQELKLKVRDAIGVYMQPIISDVSNIEEGRQIIKESLKDIEQQASQVIAAEGCDYQVNASLTITDFPEKTYGNYTFPAGKYEALEVVIGKGKGHNWWCVMYPNLCFVNSTYEIVEEEAEKTLEQVLTPEEYKSLMEDKNYEIKFVLFDWLKEKFCF
ncbi:MAG: stage II sporulation protein R [Lachnospiraceae bacterium]